MTPRLVHPILIAVLVAGIVGADSVAQAQNVKVQRLGGGRYMTETVREAPAADLKSLRIIGPENLGGSITVTAKPVTTTRLELLKIFKVPTEAEALTFEREIQFDLRTVGFTLELEVRARSDAPWEGRDQSARFEITFVVPENWDLEVRGRFFEMDLAGPFRRCEISTEYGRIKLANVTQKSRVVGNYTGMELSGVKGEIVAQTSFADLVLRDAIPSAERPAQLTNQNGSIVVEKFAGALAAESQNAPIFLSDVVLLGSGSSLRAANAMIKADIAEFGNAELDVTNSNNSVILNVPKSLSARLSCSVGSGGSINTGGLIVQTHPNQFGAGRLEGIIGSGKGLIDIDISGPGHIGIQGR